MGIPAVGTISPHELRDRLSSAAPPKLLDVRTPNEFETAHIAGAHNVPLDTFEGRPSDIVDRLHGDVVLVCRSDAARIISQIEDRGADGR